MCCCFLLWCNNITTFPDLDICSLWSRWNLLFPVASSDYWIIYLHRICYIYFFLLYDMAFVSQSPLPNVFHGISRWTNDVLYNVYDGECLTMMLSKYSTFLPQFPRMRNNRIWTELILFYLQTTIVEACQSMTLNLNIPYHTYIYLLTRSKGVSFVWCIHSDRSYDMIFLL